jgi:hypothetical protein
MRPATRPPASPAGRPVNETTQKLLDFYELVKEVAAQEDIDLDAAAVVAAKLWPYLHDEPAPVALISPAWPPGTIALAA